jgi:hypothetical protein
MAIPELTRHRAERLLERFCERRVPPRFHDQVRLSVETRGNSVTLFEHRTFYRPPHDWIKGPVAQFRYDPASNRWTLYWRDRHARWHRYEVKRPTADIGALIQEVDQDPTANFWG